MPAILTGDFPKPNGVATSKTIRKTCSLCSEPHTKPTSPNRRRISAPPGMPEQVQPWGADRAPCQSWLPGRQLVSARPHHPGCGEARGMVGPETIRPDQQVDAFFPSPRSERRLPQLHARRAAARQWQYMPSGRRYLTGSLPAGNQQGACGRTHRDTPSRACSAFCCSCDTPTAFWGGSSPAFARAGLYRRALVAVVADHGASFIPDLSRRISVPRRRGGSPGCRCS